MAVIHETSFRIKPLTTADDFPEWSQFITMVLRAKNLWNPAHKYDRSQAMANAHALVTIYTNCSLQVQSLLTISDRHDASADIWRQITVLSEKGGLLDVHYAGDPSHFVEQFLTAVGHCKIHDTCLGDKSVARYFLHLLDNGLGFDVFCKMEGVRLRTYAAETCLAQVTDSFLQDEKHRGGVDEAIAWRP